MASIPRPYHLYLRLLIGVLSVSLASIFIRLADTNPLTVAAYRMTLGALIVSVPAALWARGQFWTLRRADLPWLLLSGLFLAAHFAAWISSLSFTSVANSVFLVTTTPLFVAVGSHFALRERLGPALAAAVALSLLGGATLAFGGGAGEERHLLGDSLAVLGAMAVAVHMLIGRKVRAHLDLMPYITIVYSVAAVTLLVTVAIARAPLFGLPAPTYGWVLLAALIPQAIGHTTLNWALAHLSATTVTLWVRVEPIVATLLAIPVLGEVPPWTVVPGGLFVLAGVALAVRHEARRAARAEPSLGG